jgi:biopolymer transport protein ExbD
MAATFSKSVLEVALAEADSAAAQERVNEKLTVTIMEDGRVFFDETPVSEGEFAARMAALPQEAPIVFNVDKGAPFGPFVQVLDTAKGQQRTEFVINAGMKEKKKDGGSGDNK